MKVGDATNASIMPARKEAIAMKIVVTTTVVVKPPKRKPRR